MDNQNQSPESYQQNQAPVAPAPQTNQLQNLVPKEPNILGGLLWLFSWLIVGILLVLIQLIARFLKLPTAIETIINIISVLGGFAMIALIPIGIIKAIAKFSGK